MKIYKNQEYMTVDEVKKDFYPNCVLLVRCSVDHYAPVAGYVAAAEEHESDDYEELAMYRNELLKEPATNGEVFLIITRKPYEGEGLFIEFAE